MCVNISRKGEEGEECRDKDQDGHGKWVGVWRSCNERASFGFGVMVLDLFCDL